MKRYNVRPSKATSLIAFWMGIGMSIIGIVLLFMTIASGQWLPVLFLVVWTFGTVSFTIYHGKNAFGENGVASEHIEYEETNTRSYEEELRKLKGLLDDGIITQIEFENKKAEILSKKW